MKPQRMLALSRADGGNWTGEQLPAWVTFEGAFQHQARVTRLAGTHFFLGGAADHTPSAHIFEDVRH